MQVMSAHPIVSNEIYLYYRLPTLSFEHPAGVTLGEIARCEEDDEIDCIPSVPQDQLIALKERYKDTAIWKPLGVGKTRISPDLNPALRELLQGKHVDLLRCWCLEPKAEQFFKKFNLYEESVDVAERSNKELWLNWSAAAKERLTSANTQVNPVKLCFKQLRLWVMGTATAFAELHLSIATTDGTDVATPHMMEAVAALSRHNKCRWYDQKSGKLACSRTITLGSLIRALALGHANTETLSRRVPSYSFIRLKEQLQPAELDKVAGFLSRRYTDAYEFDVASNNVSLLRDFKNLRHAISEEGAATVINPDENGEVPSFLENFQSSVLASAYSPIALTLWNEQSFLTRGRVKVLKTRSEQASVDELTGLMDDALLFRLFYRHAHASDISMHNDFSSAFRKVLGLDKKLEELQKDVEAVRAKLLSAKQAEERYEEQVKYRKYYWITILGSAALAGLTTYTISNEFFNLVAPTFSEFAMVKEYFGIPTYPDKKISAWISIFCGFVIIILTVFFGNKKKPKKPTRHHEGHITLHAMQSHMIKRNLL
ncbi:MAG: hypothetical protein ABJN24_01070 [Hyphomicrobiales bacterium]